MTTGSVRILSEVLLEERERAFLGESRSRLAIARYRVIAEVVSRPWIDADFVGGIIGLQSRFLTRAYGIDVLVVLRVVKW